MLFKGATFVKKNSCLVERTVSLYTAGLQTYLEQYQSNYFELDLVKLMTLL